MHKPKNPKHWWFGKKKVSEAMTQFTIYVRAKSRDKTIAQFNSDTCRDYILKNQIDALVNAHNFIVDYLEAVANKDDAVKNDGGAT